MAGQLDLPEIFDPARRVDRSRQRGAYTRCFVLAITLVVVTASAEVIDGRVVSVADGDTITLLDSNHSISKPFDLFSKHCSSFC